MSRILLVEDNELNRDMLSRRLHRLGYDVITAEDGVEGVRQTQEAMPDLVLMDMSLPVMDGWEATRQLKAAEKTAMIPVIGLSAHAMEGDAERAMAAGCDDYDTKPIDVERLAGKISRLMQNDKAQ